MDFGIYNIVSNLAGDVISNVTDQASDYLSNAVTSTVKKEIVAYSKQIDKFLPSSPASLIPNVCVSGVSLLWALACATTSKPSSSDSGDTGAEGSMEADCDRDDDGFAFDDGNCPDTSGTGIYDCDDDDINNFPGNEETCDYQDNDCDEEIDEDVETIFYADYDGDGYTDLEDTEQACIAPEEWYVETPTEDDCDDYDATIYPDAYETLRDGVDSDCDGDDDEDFDRDGSSVNAGDCNDLDPSINQGAVEIEGNTVDENCDGFYIDCSDPDRDGDGYDDIACGGNDCLDACPDNEYGEHDCTDGTFGNSINPGQDEIACNYTNDDCNAATDDDDGTCGPDY